MFVSASVDNNSQWAIILLFFKLLFYYAFSGVYFRLDVSLTGKHIRDRVKVVFLPMSHLFMVPCKE